MAVLVSADSYLPKETLELMEIKFTIQGLLIYVSILLYLEAFLLGMARFKRLAATVFTLGFAAAGAAFVYRWLHVGHVPLQNLFDVFLTLGMLVWPISVLCRRLLGVGGMTADMLLGSILLFVPGFVLSAEIGRLPPALQSPLFGPHVATYMLA